MSIPWNSIVLGECLPLLESLPEGSVDLVVSSPPYNLGKEYEVRRALEVYLQEQRRVLGECYRVLKSSGSLFWQVGSFSYRGQLIPLDVRFFPILEELGFFPRNRIVWVRQHGVHGKKKFSLRYETLLWFTKGEDYLFDLDPIRVPQKYPQKAYHKGPKRGQVSGNPKGKNPGDVWVFRNVKHNHEEQTTHPCQFPEDMVSRIILSTTRKEDRVFDPYMGSGTVAVVCRDHGRVFLGAEKEYHSICLRRLSGEPNEEGRFPNLRTLRDYVERTGESIEKFSFDVQVGSTPSSREKSRIHPEEHHLQTLFERLEKEEEAFSDCLREEPE